MGVAIDCLMALIIPAIGIGILVALVWSWV
jgi:hypothetical protein